MVDVQQLAAQIAVSVVEWVESAEGDFLNHEHAAIWETVYGSLPGVRLDPSPLIRAVTEGDVDRIGELVGEVVSPVASAGAQAAALLLAACQAYVEATVGPQHATAMLQAVREVLPGQSLDSDS